MMLMASGRAMLEREKIFTHVRGLLFDFDGTLVRPSIDFTYMRQVVLDVVRDFGLEEEATGHPHVLELIRHIRALLDARDHGAGRVFEARAQQAIREVELEAAERTVPYAGVPEMLWELRQRGFAVGIVTRNCREALQRILTRFPLAHDVLLTRDDVSQVKPDPQHLLLALERLQVPQEEALMCGDHPMDVVAGQKLKMATVAVLRPGVEPSYFDHVSPDIILERVTDLLAYLPGRVRR